MPDPSLTWRVPASVEEVLQHVHAAAAHAGLSVELGPDQTLDGALCGWAYTGTAFGTPTGRMDVAELRLSTSSTNERSLTDLRVTLVETQLPNRFAKPWIYHEIRVRKPLMWSSFARTLHRLLSPLNFEP